MGVQQTAAVSRLGNRKGFTLIEMAIVLVIIGIIMGAIMKGQDLIKGAQAKEFANSFVGKWQTIASNYYDKTGRYLGDGSVNGGLAAQTTADGFMDGLLLTGATQEIATGTALSNAGIDPCTLIKSKLTITGGACGTGSGIDIGQTTVEGQYANSTVAVGFYNYKFTISGTTGGLKNVLVFQNVPADVAAAIDKQYDGVADGTMGSVINLSACSATPTLPAVGSTVTATYPYSGAASGYLCNIGIIL